MNELQYLGRNLSRRYVYVHVYMWTSLEGGESGELDARVGVGEAKHQEMCIILYLKRFVLTS